ncbi:hypothetical protein MPG67_02630 [Helicobacter pylori]|uniref:hypothetical protein n=1 Tax=Helicobacter pylori TaxID=210 RepID=UPI001FD3F61C|nr:hypothetical protein [Helicobacter pylori]UOS16250.1 hypothetical protein MPG85_02455 [Helicobacter pylori]UOS51305.1 hypothetical protein MPG67_02630 [Helicobacter pylori]
MILRAQTNFVKFLEQVLEVLKEVEIDKTECSTLLESIQKQQLVIPVVGNFSAGKSTLFEPLFRKERFAYRYHARDFFSYRVAL